MLGFIDGCCIFAHSKKGSTQVPVADSTAHSESGAIFQGAKYGKYIDNWLNFIKDWIVLKTPIIILNDNKSAIQIMSSYTNSGRSKHFDVQLFYVRNLVEYKFIEILYVKSIDNKADMLTKPLPYPLLKIFTSALFLCW